MSKFKKIIKSVTSLLGLSSPKAPAINIPAPAIPEIPAPPAPNRITDTGASVAIGTSADIKNQRVSGRSSGKGNRSGDAIGGLGRGGLNI
jgi:hypothetical protein